jgi:hypothetical protein
MLQKVIEEKGKPYKTQRKDESDQECFERIGGMPLLIESSSVSKSSLQDLLLRLLYSLLMKCENGSENYRKH